MEAAQLKVQIAAEDLRDFVKEVRPLLDKADGALDADTYSQLRYMRGHVKDDTELNISCSTHSAVNNLFALLDTYLTKSIDALAAYDQPTSGKENGE